MVAVVYQKDKRSGITYSYESVSHWDKEKKQSRAKRTLTGRANIETGEIITTDDRGRKKAGPQPAVKKGPVPAEEISRRFYGATYLLDAIGGKLGIARGFKAVLFRIHGNRFFPSRTISFWKKEALCTVLKNGASCTGILMEKIFHPGGAVNSLLPWEKRQRKNASACRDGVGLKKSFGRMTPPRYPAILNSSAGYSTA
ncbi:hypothetical protein FACS1894187_18150 [Synergistales bacterium]|nr:hypothetical protein FACS1894187_18150 [Synergistales bacterium]